MKILLASAAVEGGYKPKTLLAWVHRGWLPAEVAPGTTKTLLVNAGDIPLAAAKAREAKTVHRFGQGRIPRRSLTKLREIIGVSADVLRRWMFDHGVAMPAYEVAPTYLPRETAETLEQDFPGAVGKVVGLYPEKEPEDAIERRRAAQKAGRPRKKVE